MVTQVRHDISFDLLDNDEKDGQSGGKSKGIQKENVIGNDNLPEESVPLSENIALDCAKNGDLVAFLKCYEDPTSPYKDSVGNLINFRNREDGKTPLEWAAMLGRAGMVAELIKRGADINGVSPKGYGALHLAAAWDKPECLKILITCGVNTQLQTVSGERAFEIALRYNKYESICVLESAAAKEAFKEMVLAMKVDLTSPDKAKIFTKDDKAQINTLINETLDWIEKTKEAVTADYTLQQNKFLEAIDHFVQKANEPPQEKQKVKK